MKDFNFDKKFSEILDIDDQIHNSIFKMSFQDSNLEREYNNNLIKNNGIIQLIVHIYILFILFLRVFLALRGKLDINYFYIDLSLALFAACLAFILHFLIRNFYTKKIIGYALTIYLTFINAYSVLLVQIWFKDSHRNIQVREEFLMIIITLFEILFHYEFDFFFFLFLWIINVGVTLFTLIYNMDPNKQRILDFFIAIFSLSFGILLKKKTSFLARMDFIKNYKIKKYFSYCYDSIDNMKELQFSLKRKKLVIYNQEYRKNLKESNILRKLCEKYIKINQDERFRINQIINELNNLDDLKNKNKSNKITVNNLNYKIFESLLNSKFNLFKIINNKNNLSKRDEENVKIMTENNLKVNCDKNFKFYSYYSIFNEKLTEKNIISNQIKRFPKIDNSHALENIQENFYNIKTEELGSEAIEIFSEYIIDNMNEEINELFLRNIKTKNLSNDFTNYYSECLFEIIEKLNNNDINSFVQMNEFKILGNFYLEEDFKWFQILVRKSSEYKELIDILVYDISKIKEAEELEFNLKSKFFAKIAHELKTPLNSIICLIKNLYGLLRKNLISKEIKNSLDQIQNLSEYVIYLINDIIEYSTMHFRNRFDNSENIDEGNEEKSFNLEIKPVNLKKITKFCRNVLKTLLINKGKGKYIKVKYEFDERVINYDIFSNEFRLKEILLNFISNATKFTKSGFIKIQIQLIEGKEKSKGTQNLKSLNNNDNVLSNQNNKNQLFSSIISINNMKNEDNSIIKFNCFSDSFVKISIIDSGIGIKNQELKSFLNMDEFDFFLSKNFCNQEGSGLGLSISKLLAKKLKHEIEIESTYGEGSCFSLYIKAFPNLFKESQFIKDGSPFIEKKIKSCKDLKMTNEKNIFDSDCNIISFSDTKSISFENRKKSKASKFVKTENITENTGKIDNLYSSYNFTNKEFNIKQHTNSYFYKEKKKINSKSYILCMETNNPNESLMNSIKMKEKNLLGNYKI